jgi:CBS domain-containing protein
MKLEELLEAKGNVVQYISPEATLQDAVNKLVEHRIGSLLVSPSETRDAKQLLGIITERDILYASASKNQRLFEVTVENVMSSHLITGTPDDEVEEVMGLMTDRRIRHLPVLANGQLVGIISIGDVVKAQRDRLAMENQFMKDYIGRQR